MQYPRRIGIALVAIGTLFASGAASAVDGVVLIDQNKALTGGVTPGDAPGFPVTITQPGSYRLSSNLVVPDQNTDAIVIAADHVTIDLNGFSILGPVDCSSGFPCPVAGLGSGITTTPANTSRPPHFNITVHNGTIQGMGFVGLFLRGDSNRVSYINARSNALGGISLLASTDAGSNIVEHSSAQSNGFAGITVFRGRASYNTASGNGGEGITMFVGNALYNVSTGNGGDGLSLGDSVSYVGNVIDANGRFPVDGGHNQGQNLCNGATCPGAQF